MDSYRRTYIDRNDPSWSFTNPETAQVIEEYERMLKRQGLIDYDDMPLLAVRALSENSWLQTAILAKYPVLFVDEYQDLGKALHAIVMNLCFNRGVRLFAVGDVDQSIYGFTGAHPDLLNTLSERNDVQREILPFNYRCGSQIVEISQYALGEERIYTTPDDAEEGAVFFHALNGRYDNQARHLFTNILPEIRERHPDIQNGDIAVLYPAAWIGDSIAEAASANGVQVIRADNNALYPRSSTLIRWLEQCAIWSCGGWRSGVPRFSKLVKSGSNIFAEALTTDDYKKEFQQELLAFLNNSRNPAMILRDWLNNIEQEVINNLIPRCRTLGDELVNFNNFLQETNPQGRAAGMTLAQFAGIGEGNERITLSTLHSSKGREFSIVILFGIDSGRIPMNQNQTIEARRLFYVGLTRAKHEAHLVYTRTSPSVFITELNQRLRN